MRARDILGEKWSTKYKRSIDCSHPKGFSQRAHCASRKKNESAGDSKDRVDYVIYVNDKPATVYDTREQAQCDLDLVKEKYSDKKFEIKRRVRSEKVDEDAGSSPGGVSPNTKMVCEIDDEQPYIKRWQDRNGIKHWEVYDWRGAFQQRFSSRRAAQEWLDAHWDKLSEGADEELQEGMRLTPQQQCGRNVWQEIQRAAKYKGIDRVNNAHMAKLKFFDGTGIELDQDIAQQLQEKLRPLCTGKNQLRVFADISTLRGLHHNISGIRENYSYDAKYLPQLREDESTVWMIEYVPAEDVGKDAIYRQTKRLYFRNHDDAQVAVTQLRTRRANVLGAGANEISARGIPPDKIR